ncbi:hypothetical protein BDZ91DRAFT_111928 [Kalaharituber pfeilii]|nr:hypothetical protein BDZ91DRAFT_111928 [Kalaharituber pfeilii]
MKRAWLPHRAAQLQSLGQHSRTAHEGACTRTTAYLHSPVRRNLRTAIWNLHTAIWNLHTAIWNQKLPAFKQVLVHDFA